MSDILKKLITAGPILAVAISGCRAVKSASTAESISPSVDSFCNHEIEKQLTCKVRDIVARGGSNTAQARKSDLFKTERLNLVVYSSAKNTSPLIELTTGDGQENLTRFENTSDLYHRNGCLAELSGGIFSEGFTPRVSLKILLSAKNADYAVFAEISDYRYHNPVHMTLDLQCDRKSSK